jgi:hypothetical protein
MTRSDAPLDVLGVVGLAGLMAIFLVLAAIGWYGTRRPGGPPATGAEG